MSALSLETCTLNLRFAALTVLELLSFNDVFQASRQRLIPMT